MQKCIQKSITVKQPKFAKPYGQCSSLHHSVMVQWLLEKSQRTWEDFIKAPGFKGDYEILKKAIQDADEEELRPLWVNFTGVCTSWAVHIIMALSVGNQMPYAFGDKQNHRAAWSQDGIVTDSSARNALQLCEGEIKTAVGW
jgi:hypothetical protein